MLIVITTIIVLLFFTSWYFREMLAYLIVSLLIWTVSIISSILCIPFLLWDWITNKEDKNQ